MHDDGCARCCRTRANVDDGEAVELLDLDCVEAGIELGLDLMAEMVSQDAEVSPEERLDERAEAGQCPAVSRHASEARSGDDTAPLNEVSPVTELAAIRMLLTRREESGEK